MESLLLGALAYYGKEGLNKNNKEQNNKEQYNKEQYNKECNKNNKELKNNYDSNIEKAMDNIESQNAFNLKNKPEFFQQFDSLTFDNISKPTAENQSYFTNSGLNSFLQRDLDFRNGYSEFQNSDMHYGVVTKEHFMHNNMIPNTSKRDTFQNTNSNYRKYEKLSGNDQYWNHKKEVEAFFEPVNNLSNPFGMPVVAGNLTDRYITSFKNNYGNLPFQSDLKIVKGIENGIQNGPYSVYRINPRNINALRSEINQKVTYLNKPLETIKKGDYRGPDYNLTKYKLPSYREITTDDLVGNSSINNKMIMQGEYVYVDSQRGENDTYRTGSAINSSKGQFIDVNTIKFSDAKKENYKNDFTHAINAVNSRPVFQNQSSYKLYENERDSTSTELHASGIYNNTNASYYLDKDDTAKTTIKELNINGNTNLGINGSYKKNNYVFSNDSILPSTHRETTTHNMVLNIAPTIKNINNQYTDKARSTIKESTVESNFIGNTAPTYQNINNQYTDIAKTTIKELTVGSNFIGNAAPTYQNINNQYTDIAKTTIKESTVGSNFIGNVGPSYQNINNQYTDIAKPTIKESTIESNFIGNVGPTFKNINNQYTDIAKPTIKESTIDSHYIGNVGPTFQNITNQYTDNAKPTIKESTIESNFIGNIGPSYQNINNQYTDNARSTIKESTVESNFIGNIGPSYQNIINQYTDNARSTIKESTIDNNYIGNIGSAFQNITNQYTDNAKPTIKESTIDNNYIGNIGSAFQNINNQYTDNAKPTIKESTIDNNYIGNIGSTFQNINNQYTDNAKHTIKESTIFNTPTINPQSNVPDTYHKNNDSAKITIKETTLKAQPINNPIDHNSGNYAIDYNDIARITIKDTTLINDYTGGASTYVSLPKSEQAERNMTCRDKKEITAMTDYTPNAKSDQIRGDINKNTVKYNNKRTTFEYVSTPGKSLNYAVTPMNNIYVNNKTDLNGNNFYKIDPIFITTMSNNPLVNDFINPKNINFN